MEEASPEQVRVVELDTGTSEREVVEVDAAEKRASHVVEKENNESDVNEAELNLSTREINEVNGNDSGEVKLNNNERNSQSYSDIVVKKADKGSAVVVWGLEEYKNEAYRQLSDENFYECIHFNPVNDVVALIDGKLNVQ
ncbi:Hypothetical predicted protein [Paramuricea clavata]|uniref:Uncharacterized protein n=1 Tax=Paramuricea clavata TaxID=317549 RepID=A0A6S7INA9_PARCT|nr:Hypothetical predicted protein [Paramuricea clavata]